MPVSRTLFSGSPYLGVYLRASERGLLAPPSTPLATERELARLFQVPVVLTTVQETELTGALVAANSHGVLVGDELDPEERRELERLGPVSVVRVRQNAMGNNVLANDEGAVVHPEFSEETVARIGKALGVEAVRGTVAGLGTVGMAAVATTRGVVVHPKATDRELKLIEETLKVPAHRSTANFGVPAVGACLIASSRALVTGRPTTPVEISHLQEGLQIFD